MHGKRVFSPNGCRFASDFAWDVEQRASRFTRSTSLRSSRDPRDICFYPRSQKLSVRGLGVMLRVERVDYWEGEL